MAKAKTYATSLVGKKVNLNINLSEPSGEPHKYAGQQVCVLKRTGPYTYQVKCDDGQELEVKSDDWNTMDMDALKKPLSAAIAQQQETINLYTDASINQVQQLPLGRVNESPFNPRTRYPADEMQEMAESAKAVGIMQPVLVRPLGEYGYELVFGHRRTRAARMANLEYIPAIVRELTDAQSAQLQAVENVQRRDLDAMDEAMGYAAFIAAHGISKDELARQIGKSRTHVYNRLKLATLHAPGQEALRAGKIRAEVATLVARVPGEKNQAKALALALEGGYGGELKSYRTARSELAEKFTLDLKSALWALDDAALVPSAGACTTCTKRSGCDKIVYADLLENDGGYWNRSPKGENVCADPDCFAEKKTAQLKINQAELEAKGKTVVAGNAARKAVDAYGNLKDGYVPIKEAREALKSTASQNPGTLFKLESVTILNPRDGKTIEVVKRQQLEAAGIPVATPQSSRELNLEQDRQRRAEIEAKAAEQTRLNIELIKKVREAAAGAEQGTFWLQKIAHIAVAGVGYYDRGVLEKLHEVSIGDLIKQIDGMSADQLRSLMLDCALVDDACVKPYDTPNNPETLLAAAKHYGIDVKPGQEKTAKAGAAAVEGVAP